MSPTEPDEDQFAEEVRRRDGLAKIARLIPNHAHQPAACGPEVKEASEVVASSGLRLGMREETQFETIRTTPKPVKGRHKLLRDDTEVDRWYRNLNIKSPNTSAVRLRRLGLFCEEINTTPRKLAAIRPKTVTELLEDYRERKSEETYVGKDGQRVKYQRDYIKTTLVAVRSWLDHMGVKLVREVTVPGADISKVQQEEVIPPEDVVGMLTMGSLKARVIKQLMAKRGLRPGAIGNSNGTDGLKLADLPELVIPSEGPVSFKVHPPRLVIRPELSKTHLRGEGFATACLSSAILVYLNDRLAKGETLSRESALVAPAATISTKSTQRPFMTSAAVSKEVRESNRPVYKQRPYGLRIFAEQRLAIAESAAGVSQLYWKHWQNQKGGIEARYTVNRPLPPDVLESMRNAFARAEPFLDVEAYQETEDEKIMRQVQGISPNADKETLGRVVELLKAVRKPEPGATSGVVGGG